MVVARRWALKKAFHGNPTPDDFEILKEELPPLKDDEIMIEALYFTVDPYMRLLTLSAGQSPLGEQVARVIESKSKKYPVGKLVLAMVGWRDKTVLSTDTRHPFIPAPAPSSALAELPDLGDFSPSLFLGILGMPGMTAYIGCIEKLRPKAGDVVLVSAAAGAVGSAVGQIAKIKGCTVIGSAGSQEKCDWLKQLGFDHVFNYKQTTVEEALKKFAPNGVDCYFDNVGGEYTQKVLGHMRFRGRICCCGRISQYNSTTPGQSADQDILGFIQRMELVVSGIMIFSHLDEYDAPRVEMAKWIKEGKLKYFETLREDFTKLPDAFVEIFKGTASGKIIVKA